MSFIGLSDKKEQAKRGKIAMLSLLSVVFPVKLSVSMQLMTSPHDRIQALVDNSPPANNYCTDGYTGYIDVVYPGKHIRNIHNKKDTCGVESVNADLRHYIPILRRRSRCFPRSIETLKVVLEFFADAYNAFGIAKMKYRQNSSSNSRELPFSVLDFL